jgi:hypothetical protein
VDFYCASYFIKLNCTKKEEKRMTGHILIIIGAAITIVWGVAHLFPTKSVVKGFGDISTDNKNIIAMEWIVEGVSLIFIGIVVLGVSFIDAVSDTAAFVFLASAGILIVLALVSLFTGFKVNFLPYKLCPVLFTTSAILILAGYAFLK